MLIFNYPTKKALKESIGQPLKYRETSILSNDYLPNGSLVGCNRPHLTGFNREFYATVDMENGLIKKVRDENGPYLTLDPCAAARVERHGTG